MIFVDYMNQIDLINNDSSGSYNIYSFRKYVEVLLFTKRFIILHF